MSQTTQNELRWARPLRMISDEPDYLEWAQMSQTIQNEYKISQTTQDELRWAGLLRMSLDEPDYSGWAKMSQTILDELRWAKPLRMT